MGVRSDSLPSLMELLAPCEPKGSILQVGVVSLLMSPRALLKELQSHDLCVAQGDSFQFRKNHAKIAELFRTDRHIMREGLRGQPQTRSDVLFHAMGFEEVYSVDVAPHDDPTFLFDLNDTGMEHRIGRQFDTVLELGTLEHVFHVPNALWNLVKLCAVGGEIVHGAPMNNWPNHGFYQLSPTLFYDFYQANGCEVIEAFVCQIPTTPGGRQVRTPYSPDMSFRSPIPLDGHPYNFQCRVRKTRAVETMTIPSQGAYRALDNWKPVSAT